MKLSVKEKIKNGKKVKGIINENLKEIVPFEFEEIKEVVSKGYYSYSYYICSKEDGTCSVYDEYGHIRLSYTDGYKVIGALNYNSNVFVVSKDDLVGVIRSNDVYEDRDIVGYEIKEVYPLSSNISFEQEKDNAVKIRRQLKKSERVGYLYHPRVGSFKPVFNSLDFFQINGKKVGFYQLSNGHEKGYPSYSKGDFIEYDKFTKLVEALKYSKVTRDNGVVYGLKQKVLDTENSSYHYHFKMEDFLPCEYSSIQMDNEKQMFYLQKVVDGKVKKGFVGYAFNWNFFSKGWWVWGFPNLLKTVELEPIYDDYKIVDDKYVITSIDGKYGLFEYSYNFSNGDYDYNDRSISACPRMFKLADCIYDEIRYEMGQFIGVIDGKEVIITDFYDKDNRDKNVVVDNNYKKINGITTNSFVGTLDESKDLIHLSYERSYYKDYGSVDILNDVGDVSLIMLDGYKYYLVTKDGVKCLYHILDKAFTLLDSNIKDIESCEDKKYMKITKDNGHVSYYSFSGTLYFSSEELGIDMNSCSVSYNYDLDLFMLTENNITRLIKGKRINLNQGIYLDREFVDFNTCNLGREVLVGYREIVDGCVDEAKLCNFYCHRDNPERVICSGEFSVDNIVEDGTRIIIELTNGKYGVIESREGNVCIDFEYDSINYDSYHKVFVCKFGEDEYVFDKDGFSVERPSNIYLDNMKKVLK